MELLNKFAAVQIEADRRISEEDKAFCQRQQEAFDKSGAALQKLADMMTSIVSEQEVIFAGHKEDAGGYLSSGNVYTCESNNVFEAMKYRNQTFINNLVSYFTRKYKVKLDAKLIQEHLIPAKPKEPKIYDIVYYTDNPTPEDMKQYREQLAVHRKDLENWEAVLRTLPLRYEQIVDEIFVQLGGFSFEERAMNEFLERTWNACHYRYDYSWNNIKEGDEHFEIKNAILRIPNGVHVSYHSEYTPTEDFLTILDAIAFYQCGRMNEGHLWFPDFRSTYSGPKENVVYTRNMSKVESIKCFKNGRVDIKFRSAAYVQEFAEQCLRRRPSKAVNN